MRLLRGWKKILCRAWSIRLILLAGALSAVEALLPYYADVMPRGLFSLVSTAVIIGAFIARITAQRDLGDEDET